MKPENRKAAIREILQTLINKGTDLTFTRNDIDMAIMENRGWDKRTIQNWFDYLWKLGYLQQPTPRIYSLNLSKVAELEVKLPINIDPNQRRLFNV